jgi:hypothetical protein
MRLDSFIPAKGFAPDPITKGPVPSFETELEGRHYDIFDNEGSVWVFAVAQRPDQGGKGLVYAVKFNACGVGYLRGDKAKDLLERFNAKWPLPLPKVEDSKAAE